MPSKLEEVAEQVVRRYRRGESSNSIAADYDVTPKTVLTFLRSRGVKINAGKSRTPVYLPTKAEIEAATEEIQANWTEAERERAAGQKSVELEVVRVEDIRRSRRQRPGRI